MTSSFRIETAADAQRFIERAGETSDQQPRELAKTSPSVKARWDKIISEQNACTGRNS